MGHEQVKISEKFVLHTEYDHSTPSLGYYFSRNKNLKLNEHEGDAVKDEGKGN